MSSSPARARKAVIPAAGLGTRFLPATKAVPKEMIPVVDKPAIQYVVEEASRAGLADVLMVTGRNKGALEDHFDRAYELEDTLEGQPSKKDLLERVRAATDLATVHFVRQQDPRGLGHAVLCAADHVGGEPFAVLLGDDLIDERDPVLPRMIEVQQRYGGCVICLLEVPREQIRLYGAAATAPTGEADVVRVTGMVEKPEPAEAPSNLAMIGRYVLAAELFDIIRSTPPGRGGEIQLTDAIEAYGKSAGPVHGVVFRGRRYDTGDKGDYLRSVVQLAADRPDLGPDFLAWLQEWLPDRLAGGDEEPVRP
jgi:UTP--glucose-1-phosphate uridylyltransferase